MLYQFEPDFGLLAFPTGSPLAGVGGCSASKTAMLRCNSIAKKQIEIKTITLHEINVETLIVRVCRTTSVVFELDFGLLAFPTGSPLAGVGGCSASKTAFTSVNLLNR